MLQNWKCQYVYVFWFKCELQTMVLIAGLFAVLGISALVSLLNAMLLISLVLLATWGYCRHSGELREVGTKIDEFAQLVWDLVSTLLS